MSTPPAAAAPDTPPSPTVTELARTGALVAHAFDWLARASAHGPLTCGDTVHAEVLLERAHGAVTPGDPTCEGTIEPCPSAPGGGDPRMVWDYRHDGHGTLTVRPRMRAGRERWNHTAQPLPGLADAARAAQTLCTEGAVDPDDGALLVPPTQLRDWNAAHTESRGAHDATDDGPSGLVRFAVDADTLTVHPRPDLTTALAWTRRLRSRAVPRPLMTASRASAMRRSAFPPASLFYPRTPQDAAHRRARHAGALLAPPSRDALKTGWEQLLSTLKTLPAWRLAHSIDAHPSVGLVVALALTPDLAEHARADPKTLRALLAPVPQRLRARALGAATQEPSAARIFETVAPPEVRNSLTLRTPDPAGMRALFTLTTPDPPAALAAHLGVPAHSGHAHEAHARVRSLLRALDRTHPEWLAKTLATCPDALVEALHRAGVAATLLAIPREEDERAPPHTPDTDRGILQAHEQTNPSSLLYHDPETPRWVWDAETTRVIPLEWWSTALVQSGAANAADTPVPAGAGAALNAVVVRGVAPQLTPHDRATWQLWHAHENGPPPVAPLRLAARLVHTWLRIVCRRDDVAHAYPRARALARNLAPRIEDLTRLAEHWKAQTAPARADAPLHPDWWSTPPARTLPDWLRALSPEGGAARALLDEGTDGWRHTRALAYPVTRLLVDATPRWTTPHGGAP